MGKTGNQSSLHVTHSLHRFVNEILCRKGSRKAGQSPNDLLFRVCISTHWISIIIWNSSWQLSRNWSSNKNILEEYLEPTYLIGTVPYYVAFTGPLEDGTVTQILRTHQWNFFFKLQYVAQIPFVHTLFRKICNVSAVEVSFSDEETLIDTSPAPTANFKENLCALIYSDTFFPKIDETS